MKFYSYAPYIEVYAMCVRDDKTSYYDLSDDVVSVNVGRKSCAVSTASITLQNKGAKYIDFFMPWDAVKIFVTKDKKRVPLFTGYIKSVPRYNLYDADISLECMDTLYRLQNLYWDKDLVQSSELLEYGHHDGSWARVLSNLLIAVAGYSPEMIIIGDIPDDVQEWALSMYEAQHDEIAQMDSIRNEFYEMLRTTGPSGDFSVMSGDKIVIPSNVNQKGTYTITMIDKPSANGFWLSKSLEIYNKWAAAGKKHDDGVCTLNGRYLIACSEKFGTVGDKVDFVFDDGTVLHTIVMDIKSQADKNYDPEGYGHTQADGSVNIIEFEVLSYYWQVKYNLCNPGSGGWHTEWHGKKIKYAVNGGSIL